MILYFYFIILYTVTILPDSLPKGYPTMSQKFLSALGFALVIVFLAFLVSALNLGGVSLSDILPAWMTSPLF